MNTVFYLLRHGSHSDLGRVLTGRTDRVSLTPAGEAEALALGKYFAVRHLDALYTSPRLRARQTAEIVAKELGMEPGIEDALDEIDFGRWSGKTFDALAADPEWLAWNKSRDTARTPAGETMSTVAARVCGLIERLRKEFPGGRVALVSHSDVIKAAVCSLMNLPFQRVHAFEIDPGSLTSLSVGEDGAALTALNNRPARPADKSPEGETG